MEPRPQLVEGPGHCGECHTPRGLLGELNRGRALAGAPLPDGHGKSPSLRGGDFLNWTTADIVEALTSGFTMIPAAMTISVMPSASRRLGGSRNILSDTT